MGVTDQEFNVRMQRRKERAMQLAPLLSVVVKDAVAVYSELRPKALHVSKVERDYPLRHQQVSGLAPGSPTGFIPVADYLMVSLGDHRDFVIYKDQENYFKPRWQITRNLGIATLAAQQTKIDEARESRSNHPNATIEVATYTYTPEYGHNPYIGELLCSTWNEYENAELYVAELTDDLTQALVLHG